MRRIGYFVYPSHEQFGGAEIRAIEFAGKFNQYAEAKQLDVRIQRVWSVNDVANVHAVILYGAHFKNYPFLISVKKNTKAKVIVSSVFVKTGPYWIYRLLRRMRRPTTTVRLSYEVLSLADVIFTTSQYEKYLLKKCFGLDDRVYVLPNLIDCAYIFKVTLDKGCPSITQMLSLEDLDLSRTLLCVGRIEPIKNQVKLLESFPRDLGIQLLFIGDLNDAFPTYCSKFKRLVNRYGETVFHIPSVDRNVLLRIMASSRGLILPSLFETTGRVALEALVTGCPVAVSSLPTLAEYLVGMDNVVFFNPRYKWSIRRAILKLTEQKIRAVRCRKDLHFCYEQGLPKYQEFFEKEVLQ